MADVSNKILGFLSLKSKLLRESDKTICHSIHKNLMIVIM